MEEINIGGVNEGSGGKKSPALTVIIVVVIIAIIAGLYFWLGGDSYTAVEKPQEEQTLSAQISEGIDVDNPASEVPQANVFETDTNPFSDDGFKNPFE